MSLHTKIYILELKRNKWYVGSTYRELYARLEEHEQGYGSVWTSRHGYKRLLCYFDVPAEACTELEDKLTEVLMHRFEHTKRARRELCELPQRLLRQ